MQDLLQDLRVVDYLGWCKKGPKVFEGFMGFVRFSSTRPIQTKSLVWIGRTAGSHMWATKPR